jgi:hypothetical protein
MIWIVAFEESVVILCSHFLMVYIVYFMLLFYMELDAFDFFSNIYD